MKLISVLDALLLEVETTGGETIDLVVPRHNIHYWYPFNINFFYKFTDAKEFLYLVMEKNYDGPNYYNVDILKRTKQLEKKNGVMFHPEVYKRNMETIHQAWSYSIPAIVDEYTLEDVQVGFYTLSEVIADFKNTLEVKYEELSGEFEMFPSEEWDTKVYSLMTDEQRETFLGFGEIYTMLSVMRKLAEGRE